MIPLEIPRRQRHCLRGEEPFTPGMAYASRLTLLKDRHYAREDFCLACWAKESFNLETAVQDGKVMQDFELESSTTGGEHSQMVKAPPVVGDYGSKGCVSLPSSIAVSRFKGTTVWKGEVPVKTALEKKTDRLEKALEILREGLESPSSDDQKEAFLLALFLQRKKWLVSRGEFRRKGRESLLFEVVETEEMIEVPKVTVTPADALLQERIAQKLCI